MKSAWAGGETSGGRYCSVFKFRDGRKPACTSTSIPTIRERINHDLGG